MAEVPASHPFAISLTAGVDDVDVQDRVSNVAVVAWLVRAATEHSAALGWDHQAYVDLGGFFVVRRHEIDYLAAAVAGDAITVFTWPSGVEKAKAERSYVVIKNGDTVLARAVTIWSFVDAASGRPRRIPPELAETFDPARFL